LKSGRHWQGVERIIVGSKMRAAVATITFACGVTVAPSVNAQTSSPTDLNGTWAGPVGAFTDDGIPVPAVTRNVGWLPFSQGLPENRKAPNPEEQLKQRAEFLKRFRAVNDRGGNVFSRNGPIFGNAPKAPLTDAGAKALAAAQAASLTNKIKPSDVNSLLHCYPTNYTGFGDVVTIVQGPKAIAFFSGTRTRIVYMDGRSFDSAPTSDYGGYSIGHWEGSTLVVETRKFRGPTLHAGFAGPEFPLSAQSKVTEYISKIEGGRTLQIKTILQDPIFLREREGKMEYLSWTPDTVPVDENCVEGLAGQIEYDETKFKPN
jgi:hypothetical protein